jgi:hypothetical protein
MMTPLGAVSYAGGDSACLRSCGCLNDPLVFGHWHTGWRRLLPGQEPGDG